MQVEYAHYKTVYHIPDEKIPQKKAVVTRRKFGNANSLFICLFFLLIAVFLQFGLPDHASSQIMTKARSKSNSENQQLDDKAKGRANHDPKPSRPGASGPRNSSNLSQSIQNNKALLQACWKGDLETVRRLLDQDIDLNLRSRAKKLALVEAAKGGHIEIMDLLLEKGAQINLLDHLSEFSALMIASQSGNLAAVKFLIEKGAVLDTFNRFGQTALTLACWKAHFDIAKLLIENGSDVNFSYKGRKTPIFQAANSGRLDLVKFLVESGADIHAKNKQDDTIFMAASGERGTAAILEYLLEQGADINERNKYGNSPLLVACANGRTEVVKFLLEKGADIKSSNTGGGTALMMATLKGNLETVKALVSYNADIHAKDRYGNTALLNVFIGAETDEKIEVIQYLLNMGAVVNYKNSRGVTGLIRASRAGFPKAVNLLISKGARINAATKESGQTALISASQGGHTEVVKILLEKGADVHFEDNMALTAVAYAANDDIRNMLKQYGATETIISPENFELLHALPFDNRLVEGLRLAFNQYIRLFGAQPGKSAAVTVAVDQLNTRQYRVTYSIDLNGTIEKYDLEISNQGQDVRKNIQGMVQVLSKFAGNRNYKFQPRQFDDRLYSDLKSKISEQISYFDYIDMLKALLLVEQKALSGNHGPRILYSAAEIYSWLAVFKSANRNPILSDELSTRATCYYLLGSLGNPKASKPSFYEGLLLLGLDYPAAAAESFTLSSPMEHLLSAYIQYDFDKLKSMVRDPKINKRLLSYLTARAYEKSIQWNVALTYYSKMMKDYPDFLLAKEFVVRKGSVGISRRYMQTYLVELLEKHLNLIGEFMKTDWIDYNRDMEMEIQRNVPEHDMLSKWIRLHARLVDRPNQLKQFKCLLEVELLNLLLKEDIATALLTNFDLESRKLGRMTNATSIMEMVDQIYPDSTLSKVMNLQMPGNDQKAWSILDTVSVRDTDRLLLITILNFIEQALYSEPKRFIYLKKYRKDENPSAGGLLRLAEFYKKCFYRPLALNCLRNGLSVDPYNYRFYEEILNFEEGQRLIADGKAFLGNHYGFLTTAAGWYYKNGDSEKAIADYQRAIAKNPYQEFAYRKLGDIYLEQERLEEAVSIWQAYLKFDNSSLSAVVLKNMIGRAWMDEGKYSEAYQILSEAKESWKRQALLNFAEISEKTGKILQAEQYYKNAAQRYPDGVSPAKLGVFYLRQNNPELAYDIFRKFKNYNQSQYYYYPDLVQHYLDLGKPHAVIQTVHEIDGKRGTNFAYLARILAEKKQFKLAIRQLEEGLMKSFDIYKIRALIDYNLDGEQITADRLVEKYLKTFKRNVHKLRWFGDSLMTRGHYDSAFEFYRPILRFKNSVHRPNAREEALLKMALAWSLGSRDPSGKEEIKSRLVEFPENKWLQSCVLFLIGEIDQQTMFELAGSSSKIGELYYYLGVYDYNEGKHDEALKKLLVSLESMQWRQNGYNHAYNLAKKLAE